MLVIISINRLFIGNGYIGISLDGSHGVWLKGERGLDIATDYNPLVHFSIKGYDVKGNYSIVLIFLSLYNCKDSAQGSFTTTY